MRATLPKPGLPQCQKRPREELLEPVVGGKCDWCLQPIPKEYEKKHVRIKNIISL